MKFKKMFAALLSLTVLSMASLTVFAQTPLESKVINEQVDQEFEFGSFTGQVVEINPHTGDNKMVSLEDEEGMPINMVISQDTYVVNKTEIKVGDIVTGYFDINAPMIMIYPPQYSPEVVVVENEDQQVKVDVFNQELVSSDNMLKLNIAEDTEIVTKDGKPFTGELVGGKLVVIYDMSTKSIPAQTTPIKVIVLDQVEDIEEPDLKPIGDVSNKVIVVNDKKINSPSAYTNQQGAIMVPLRPVAEALEFEVVWDGQLKQIQVGIGAVLTIDKDEYIFAKMAAMELGSAPELKEGRTFVPLDFFTKVLQLDKTEVTESQIIIQ